MPRNKTRLSCLFTNVRRGGERAPAGECFMTSSAFNGAARDDIVYLRCSNPECRRAGCVTCWELVADSLEEWSREKSASFKMIQHPIFTALAERAWRDVDRRAETQTYGGLIKIVTPCFNIYWVTMSGARSQICAQ